MHDQSLWFDPSSLSKLVDKTTFGRGQAYARRGTAMLQEVVPDEKDAASWEIGGEVLGSSEEPYSTQIHLTIGKSGGKDGQLTNWRAYCSCPMGFNCKHGVALTLDAARFACDLFDLPDYRDAFFYGDAPTLDKKKAQEMQAHLSHREQLIQQQRLQSQIGAEITWLQSASSVNANKPAAYLRPPAPGAPEKGLAFVLSEKSNAVPKNAGQVPQIPELHLGAFEYTLHKRTGRAGVLRNVEYFVTKEHYAPHLVSDKDIDLLQLLRSQISGGYYAGNKSAQLKGEIGCLLLNMAVDTGHLYWEGDNKSLGRLLKSGGPRPIQWRWEALQQPGIAETLWRLHADVPAVTTSAASDLQEDVAAPAAPTRLYANTPALYVDHGTGEVGIATHPALSLKQLHNALRMPPMRQTALQDHVAQLASALPNVPMPAVIESLPQWFGIEAKAVLHIKPLPDHQAKKMGPFSARLHFTYQTQELPWPSATNSDIVNTAQGRVLIHRNRDQEIHLSEGVKQAGLAMDSAGDWWPMASDPALYWAQQFDEQFAALRQAGIEVRVPDSAQNWLQHAASAKATLAQADDGEGMGWFDMSLGIDIDGQKHNLLPWLPKILASAGQDDAGQVQWPEQVYVPLPDQRMLALALEGLKPWLNALIELVGDRPESFDGDFLRLNRWDALRVSASLGEGVPWAGADSIRKMLRQLGDANAIKPVKIPKSLKAVLRPYQHDGVNWLQFLAKNHLGGLLADDMGLGKTLQTLAHILIEKTTGRLTSPALIVAPVSLLGNWQREAERFCPALRVHVMHGADRHDNKPDLANVDVVITAYSLLQRDEAYWLAQAWHCLVLDEAQNIKNANTHAARVVGQINAHHKICLSGTPMENHLGELWSLFHFLMPGFLGAQARFAKLYRTPIEKHNDTERLDQLRRRVTPFMLRRTKTLVASELPPKQETTLPVALEGPQANLYETIRLSTEATVRKALNEKGLQRSQITILDALLKLRQVCCDPQLLPLTSGKRIKASAKLDQLMDMLPEMITEGRKILLFSQFTSMLELIEARLAAAGLKWVKLTGQSRKRDELIAQFTEGQVPLFLISLKAGGVGLNLPQADTVIHYDPWWNPAVENQATDRAHRIGQTKNVWVIKLVAQGTIEERILALQQRKAELASSLYSGAQERKQALFDESDLQQLLMPLG